MAHLEGDQDPLENPASGQPRGTRKDATRDLRRMAGKRIRDLSPRDMEALTPEESGVLLHELHLHQVELEMQNEELLQTQEQLEVSRARYFDLYDLAPVGYVSLNEDGVILEANLTAAGMLKRPRSALFRQRLGGFVAEEDLPMFIRHCRRLFETGEPQTCEMRLMKGTGDPLWVRIQATRSNPLEGEKVQCRCIMSDISDRKRIEEEREALIEQLKKSLAKVKQLSGMLPICASCKKIRDDRGYWRQIEAYIRDHSEAEFSHGICPECMKKLYPELLGECDGPIRDP